MTATLSVNVRSRDEDLPRLAQAVEEFARAQGWPTTMAYQVQLALEELALNIVNYGYDDAERGTMRGAEIRIVSDDSGVTIEIVDDGRPFDPFSEAPPPDLESGLDSRPIGGLGVHLVKTMMDETAYRREDGLNRLTLIKRRPLE